MFFFLFAFVKTGLCSEREHGLEQLRGEPDGLVPPNHRKGRHCLLGAGAGALICHKHLKKIKNIVFFSKKAAVLDGIFGRDLPTLLSDLGKFLLPPDRSMYEAHKFPSNLYLFIF